MPGIFPTHPLIILKQLAVQVLEKNTVTYRLPGTLVHPFSHGSLCTKICNYCKSTSKFLHIDYEGHISCNNDTNWPSFEKPHLDK